MAKQKREPVPQSDRGGEEFSAVPADVAAVELLDAAPEAKADPRDAELAALREENARLKAALPPEYVPGRRYRVTLKDCPTGAVVEPQPGESPADAFFRELSIVGSTHRPDAQPTDEPCGRFRVAG